jgi:hypothetical protein
MQVANDHSREVYNDDLGIVRRISFENGELVVDREAGRSLRLRQIGRARAGLRHHGPQEAGLGVPTVVTPVTTHHYLMFQRNLICTAATRGKRLVVLVSQRKRHTSFDRLLGGLAGLLHRATATSFPGASPQLPDLLPVASRTGAVEDFRLFIATFELSPFEAGPGEMHAKCCEQGERKRPGEANYAPPDRASPRAGSGAGRACA